MEQGGKRALLLRNPEQLLPVALKVGEVSGVVETKFGYHIIKRTQ